MKYALPARLFHWVMAAGFAVMWIVGFTMDKVIEDDTPLQGEHPAKAASQAAGSRCRRSLS